MTVRGARNASASPGDPSLPPAPYVVLDLGLLRSALVLWGPESRLTLEDIVVTNLAAPHPGVLSLPLYIVDVEQRGTPQGMLLSPPRILMRNVTLVVPQVRPVRVPYTRTGTSSFEHASPCTAPVTCISHLSSPAEDNFRRTRG